VSDVGWRQRSCGDRATHVMGNRCVTWWRGMIQTLISLDTPESSATRCNVT
jgi:hypothetical protein